MKTTTVLLTVPSSGISRSFSVDHAERLLRMPNNGGWQLPEDSRYVFSPTTGLSIKSKKERSKITAE